MLAAVVLVAVAGLFKVSALKHLWRGDRTEFVVAIAAIVGVLGQGLLRGVMIGAIISLVLLIRRASRPHVAFLGRIPGTRRFSDRERHPDNELIPGVMIFRPESGLMYFNMDHVRDTIVDRVRAETTAPKLVVLDLSAAPRVDMHSAQMLGGVADELTATGIRVQAVEARSSVRDRLRGEGVDAQLGGIEPVHHRRRCGRGISKADHDLKTSVNLSTKKRNGPNDYSSLPTMRALTNDYKDCKIIKIDPADPTSPYGVMQEGYDPNDPTYRTRMFYLQRDGQWIDEIARSARPDSEGGDVLFESSAEALELLGRLRGKPVVRDLPVSQDDDEKLPRTRWQRQFPQELLRQFLARYRAAKGKPSHIEKPQLAAPMPENSSERSSKRVLEPIDRVSEVLFGLIMVLTFTGSLSVAEAGRDDVRTMLIGALGCNLAWGIIDGVLYLMGCLAEKGRDCSRFAPCARPPIQSKHTVSSRTRCRRWSRAS